MQGASWQLDRDPHEIWEWLAGLSMFLTLSGPIWSTDNSVGREPACVLGSDWAGGWGHGEEGVWGYFGKIVSGGFYLYYFPSLQICYSPFFRMRKLRLKELVCLALLGRVGGLGSEVYLRHA